METVAPLKKSWGLIEQAEMNSKTKEPAKGKPYTKGGARWAREGKLSTNGKAGSGSWQHSTLVGTGSRLTGVAGGVLSKVDHKQAMQTVPFSGPVLGESGWRESSDWITSKK